MLEIKIPDDLFEGTSCLDCEIPWQTEGSIFKEAENITFPDFALEVGSGGSTVFLIRRCGIVSSIETSNEWFEKVKEKLRTINNGPCFVQYVCIPEEEKICSELSNRDWSDVNIFSVDTQGGFNRERILNAFLSKGISPNLKMIVLDNYAHPELFPTIHDKNIFEENEDWEMFTYNHPRWAGNGTKIYLKKQK